MKRSRVSIALRPAAYVLSRDGQVKNVAVADGVAVPEETCAVSFNPHLETIEQMLSRHAYPHRISMACNT